MTRAPGILAIDTCLEALSVAIRIGGQDTVHSAVIGVGHAEHLAPRVAAVLAEAGASPRDIGRLVVTRGPGSFMGARVGLAFAGGFALPHRIETLPVTTLQALWLSAPEDAAGAAVIDARREQVYLQAFGPGRRPLSAPALLDLAAAREQAGSGLLIGTGAAVLFPGTDPAGPPHPVPQRLLDAAETIEPGPLSPLYLRPPDARPHTPLFGGGAGR